MEHHHIHIGAWTIFFALSFIVAMTWLIIYALKKPKEVVKTETVYVDKPFVLNGRHAASNSYPYSTTQPSVSTYPAYSPASPVVYNNNGFVEGMLLGELMSDRNERVEVIHERDRDDTPSYDTSSSDSGFSYDSDSGSSDYSSSDSSGGIDISW
jgi:hypothetical protein